MATQLNCTFRSSKPRGSRNLNSPCPLKPVLASSRPSQSLDAKLSSRSKSSKPREWCAYLIASTNSPIKTYVGVTTDFPRRLKQHNGEIRGGAKASRAGRPWVCACIVQGFNDHSEACSFEFKWKDISRKLPRKRKLDDVSKPEGDDSLVLLLRHRRAALEKALGSSISGHLQINWQLDPS